MFPSSLFCLCLSVPAEGHCRALGLVAELIRDVHIWLTLPYRPACGAQICLFYFLFYFCSRFICDFTFYSNEGPFVYAFMISFSGAFKQEMLYLWDFQLAWKKSPEFEQIYIRSLTSGSQFIGFELVMSHCKFIHTYKWHRYDQIAYLFHVHKFRKSLKKK